MMSPSRVGAIAANTVREAIRNRLLYAVLAVSVLMIAGSVVISTLSYVEGTRIMQDLSLASIRLFAAGSAIFLGINLLHREVDRRTIYTILSKPISRSEFILGKYLGLVATIWLLIGCMAVVFAGVSLLAGAPFHAGHVAALCLLGAETVVIVAVATLFSSFTTPMLASLFTAGIWVVGHLTQNLYLLAQQSSDGQVGGLATFIYRALPDLELFNLSVEAVHGLPIPAGDIWWPVAYAVLYAALLLLAASALFSRRDLR